LKGNVAVARKEITTPQQLSGKSIATRVGSTGSWFISEYLTKNGVDPGKVAVKNLDTQVLPAALCGGDIAAFFIWQPGSRTLEICPEKARAAPPKPRGGPKALAGSEERAGWKGSASVTTVHAPFPTKVECKTRSLT
jgi:hypothetical protein